MPNFTLQQLDIITAARDTNDHLLVEARAGTGKTFTLVELLKHLRGSTVLMAFNKSIARELDARTASLPFEARLRTEIGTVHALGLKAYSAGLGRKPKINGGKLNFIQKDLFKANRHLAEGFSKVGYILTNLVGNAKSGGFGITGSVEDFASERDKGAWTALIEHFNYDLDLEKAGVTNMDHVIEHCQNLLDLSNRQSEIIDFDDMIYLPLLRHYSMRQFDNVLIDEAQDISPTRRELAFKMIAGHDGSNGPGRLIAVGDEFQAIYGFTGADAESLRNIAGRSGATRLPLTTCWRCDTAIITEAQKRVHDIEARGDASPGTVTEMEHRLLIKGLMGDLPPEQMDGIEAFLPAHGDAILCRLNRPNVSMALTLIRAGYRARIEGRDIGKKLLSHVKACSQSYAFQSLAATIVDLETWGEAQANLLASRERKLQADLLTDEVAAAVLLMERVLEGGGDDYSELEDLVDDLFADDIPPSGVITLSSVHKAKGREWGRVFILGRFDYMPFFRAIQPWELQQESNLIYVATTRAEHHLVHILGTKEFLDNQKDS